jgi:signal transduction histidine kinase
MVRVKLYNKLLYASVLTLLFPIVIPVLTYFTFAVPRAETQIENLEPMPAVVRRDLEGLLERGEAPGPTSRIVTLILDNGEPPVLRHDATDPAAETDFRQTIIRASRFSYGETSGLVYFEFDPNRPFGLVPVNRFRFLIMIIIMVLAIPATLSWFFLRGLRHQLSDLEAAAGVIAEGRLDHKLEIPADPTLSPVYEAFESMRRRLNESDDYRHRFLLAISHDLKSPLTSILGFVEVLEDRVYTSEEEYQRYLDIIRDKSHLLEQRIQELIQFARLETVEWQRDFATFAAGDFFRDLAERLALESPVRGVEFDTRMDLAESIMIRGDRLMLYRAFENLFENSVRYCPKGSLVRIAVDWDGDRSMVVVAYDDSGPGIPDSEKGLVFEHFYRGEATRHTAGTGLGLTSAQSIIQAHRGKLTLEDSNLGGVHFGIELPGWIPRD